MSWIDEAKRKLVKREMKQTAAEEARMAEAAKAAKARAASEAEEKDRFARRIKKLLPPGVELGSVFFHGYNLGGRVHVGNGVQFDLVRSTGGEGGNGWYVTYEIITAYEAGSDAGPGVRLAARSRKLVWDTFLRFRQSEIEEPLLDALEKYDERRKAR